MYTPFNKPYLSGKEMNYISQALASGKTSGDGFFTKKCQAFFEKKYGFKKCLLTTSCTSALEMAALLLNIQQGDEIIMPAYTFVSTANAFVLRGSKIVFADSYRNNPNIDPMEIEGLITPKTKAIVVVHYAGIACDMDVIMAIAQRYNLFVVEDAAHAVDSYYKDQALGGLGHLAAFSFHETKNIISGEGGMLIINDEQFLQRAEIIWEKGANRAAFFRGEVERYEWIDVGSSFLPSEITAAFLFAQLESLEDIQQKRSAIWNQYYEKLKPLENKKKIALPELPEYASNNGHIFYIVLPSFSKRQQLIGALKNEGIEAYFHYLSLHKSPFYRDRDDGRKRPNCDRFSDCLLRLPLFYELEEAEIARICKSIIFSLS